MNTIRDLMTIAITLFLAISVPAYAESAAQQWKQGLSGARLTAYSGSSVSSNSMLTVIKFCRNGSYSYHREGSWSVPGTAGGASSNRITGRWDIKAKGNQVQLTYVTDQGQRGAYRIYLQQDGRVNIGGTAYAAQRNAAGC